MSYSQVSHVAHESYAPNAPPPGDYPPPPPRPGFEQGYGAPPQQYPPAVGGPGYQGYFSDNYPPPAHIHHTGPTRPFQQPYSDYSYDSNGCSSLVRGCLTALCCCWLLEECCRW